MTGMKFTLSTKDINFLQPLFCHLGSFLVAPWYDFDKRSLGKPNLTRLYAVVLILLKILTMAWMTQNTAITQLLGDFYPSQQFLVLLISADSFAMILVTLLNSTLFATKQWRRMLINFQELDKRLDNVGHKETNIFKNFYCRFFLKCGLFVAFYTYEIHVWTDLFKLKYWELLILSGAIDSYFEFLVVIIFATLVESFRSRYRDLNHKLLKSSKREKFLQELVNIGKDFRILGETVQIFNKIFGWPVLLIIFHSALQMVQCVNLAFIFFVLERHQFQSCVLLADLYIMLWSSYIFLVVVLPINSSVDESRRFIRLLYKLQENFPEKSDEMLVLRRLVDSSKNFVTEFSAGGFFDLRKSLVLGLVGNVATYVIIMIQVNESLARI